MIVLVIKFLTMNDPFIIEGEQDSNGAAHPPVTLASRGYSPRAKMRPSWLHATQHQGHKCSYQGVDGLLGSNQASDHNSSRLSNSPTHNHTASIDSTFVHTEEDCFHEPVCGLVHSFTTYLLGAHNCHSRSKRVRFRYRRV